MFEKMSRWYISVCKRHNIDPQQFDIYSYYDSALSFDENKGLILKELGIPENPLERVRAVNKEVRFRRGETKQIIKELNEEAGIKTSFILNSGEVLSEKAFVFDVLPNDSLGIGFLLPKRVEDINRKKKVVAKRQIYSPAIITSDHKLIDVYDNSELNRLMVYYKDIPSEFKLGWELDKIREFLEGGEEIVSKEEVYKKIKTIYQKNIYYGFDEWFDFDTCWDIGTYFFNLFSTFPIYERRGIRGSGKTKAMSISRNIAFNSSDTILINPSESSLFRETNDKRFTKYIDEAEKLFRFTKYGVEPDQRIDLINSSYKKGSSVPRVEKIGNKFQTVYYKTYSPTQIGSINGLYGATEDRAIVHISTRIPKEDPRGEREVNDNNPIFQEIRNELYLLMFQNWKEIREIYSSLKCEKLKQRQFELWKPILTIARFIDDSTYDEMLKFAEKLTKVKATKDNISESSLDYKICIKVKELISNSDNLDEILIKDIMKIFANDEKKPTDKRIARIFDNLGFHDYREHFSKGNGWRLTQDDFDKIITPIIPSLSSLSSKPNNLDNTRVGDEDKMKITEEKVE